MTQEQYLEVRTFYKRDPEYLEIPAIWRKEIEAMEEDLETGEWN